MSLCGGPGVPGLAASSPLPSPGTTPLTLLALDRGDPADPDRHRDTPERRHGGLPLPRLWHALSPEPVASDCPQDSVSSQPKDAGLGPDSYTQQSPVAVKEDRKLLRQRIHSLPQWQLEASPVLKDISQLQVRRDRVRRRQREPEDEEGFVPKKLQRLGQRSRLLASHGVARRDPLAKSHCWAPELLSPQLLPWQNDTTVPQGMENLVTTPVMRKAAKLRLGKHSQCWQPFRLPSGPSSAPRPVLKWGQPSDMDNPVKAKRRGKVAGSCDQEASVELGVWLEPSKSAQLEEIKNLLANDDQELIGDFSKGAVNLPLQRDVEEFLLEQPIVPLDVSRE
ncbi:hypothetical protein DUI87_31222 [Hirundo rustica rustica]|uniref:Uncharacterized protein n=1 Tax=Hirundo rustica rustica TaxID=333673 RepID=A0A3M0IV69_HIRRU|nr:hypothetical protein DUI87_31222 [Hirundo rustica rustica]